MILGWLRLGSIATYVSHPVMVGFCSAGEILIAISQLKYMLGIKVSKAAAVTLVSACEPCQGALVWLVLTADSEDDDDYLRLG